jgi:hypothetical protein
MGLASTCGYPADYFAELGAPSLEELEVERNTVRDILRTLAGVENHERMSIKVLSLLLQECEHANPTETVVHAFSSLAKPLNHLAILYQRNPANGDYRTVLLLALRTIVRIQELHLHAFDRSADIATLLPWSRLANIATASLSPLIAALCQSNDGEFVSLLVRAVDHAVRAAALSVRRLPELWAASILGMNQYDIRGAMRTPGGEDHVGSLALMRLVFESHELVLFVLKASPDLIPRLIQLFNELKEIEVSRGQGVVHGAGVCPKSRRIILNVICHVESVMQGTTGASGMVLSFTLFREMKL